MRQIFFLTPENDLNFDNFTKSLIKSRNQNILSTSKMDRTLRYIPFPMIYSLLGSVWYFKNYRCVCVCVWGGGGEGGLASPSSLILQKCSLKLSGKKNYNIGLDC